MIWWSFFFISHSLRLKYTQCIAVSQQMSEPPWRRWRRLDLNANFWKPFSLCVPLFAIFWKRFMCACCSIFPVFGLTFSGNLAAFCVFISALACGDACASCNLFAIGSKIEQTVVWHSVAHSVSQFEMHLILSFPLIFCFYADTVKQFTVDRNGWQFSEDKAQTQNANKREWECSDGPNIRWPIFWCDNSTVKRYPSRSWAIAWDTKIKCLMKNWILQRSQLQQPLLMKLDRKRNENGDNDEKSKSDQSSSTHHTCTTVHSSMSCDERGKKQSHSKWNFIMTISQSHKSRIKLPRDYIRPSHLHRAYIDRFSAIALQTLSAERAGPTEWTRRRRRRRRKTVNGMHKWVTFVWRPNVCVHCANAIRTIDCFVLYCIHNEMKNEKWLLPLSFAEHTSAMAITYISIEL